MSGWNSYGRKGGSYRNGGRHGSWDAWRNSQDWTPQRVKDARERKDVDEKALNDRVADIRRDFDAQLARPVQPLLPVDGGAVVGSAIPASSQDAINKRKQNAIMIKQTRSLLATLPRDDPLVAILDEKLVTLRAVAHDNAPTQQVLDEAVQELAQMEIKLTKSQGHLETAKDHTARAELEVSRCRAHLNELKARFYSRSQPLSRSAIVGAVSLNAAESMAASLSSLQASSVFNPDGTVTVDPAFLEKIASEVSNLAKASSPLKTPKRGIRIISQLPGLPEEALEDPYLSAGMDQDAEASESAAGTGVSQPDTRRTHALAKFRKTNANQFKPAGVKPVRRLTGKLAPPSFSKPTPRNALNDHFEATLADSI